MVEQDSERKIDQRTLPPNCKYIFAYNKDLFNKSWGLNVGFRNSTGKAIAIADNNVIIDRDIIEDCFITCSEKYDFDAIKPFNKLIDLSKEETNKILKNTDYNSLTFKGEKIRPGISFCCAFVVFKREAYLRLGGFDERFVRLGRGCGDNAMSVFKIPLLKRAYFASGKAYHLWHKRTKNDTNSQPNYENNLKLLKEYYNYTETLKLFVKRQKYPLVKWKSKFIN